MAPVGFPGGSVVRNVPANTGDSESTPGSGRSPGEGNGYPLQCSYLESSVDGGAWQATVDGVAESDTTERITNAESVEPGSAGAVSLLCLCIYVHSTAFLMGLRLCVTHEPQSAAGGSDGPIARLSCSCGALGGSWNMGWGGCLLQVPGSLSSLWPLHVAPSRAATLLLWQPGIPGKRVGLGADVLRKGGAGRAVSFCTALVKRGSQPSPDQLQGALTGLCCLEVRSTGIAWAASQYRRA